MHKGVPLLRRPRNEGKVPMQKKKMPPSIPGPLNKGTLLLQCSPCVVFLSMGPASNRPFDIGFSVA
jgi:hypothetical protein